MHIPASLHWSLAPSSVAPSYLLFLTILIRKLKCAYAKMNKQTNK